MVSLISDFYANWLEPIEASWAESHLDCLNCKLHAHKCCEYSPFLANFSIGQIAENRQTELSRALELSRATPLGFFPAERKTLCPFFASESGLCSIWPHRPGVCVAYYCSSSRGSEGLRLRQELESYLNLFEWTLAHEALWRLGFTQDDVRAGRWFEFESQPLELYGQTAKVAREVSRREVRDLMGEEGAELQSRIRDLCERLACVMPADQTRVDKR